MQLISRGSFNIYWYQAAFSDQLNQNMMISTQVMIIFQSFLNLI